MPCVFLRNGSLFDVTNEVKLGEDADGSCDPNLQHKGTFNLSPGDEVLIAQIDNTTDFYWKNTLEYYWTHKTVWRFEGNDEECDSEDVDKVYLDAATAVSSDDPVDICDATFAATTLKSSGHGFAKEMMEDSSTVMAEVREDSENDDYFLVSPEGFGDRIFRIEKKYVEVGDVLNIKRKNKKERRLHHITLVAPAPAVELKACTTSTIISNAIAHESRRLASGDALLFRPGDAPSTFYGRSKIALCKSGVTAWDRNSDCAYPGPPLRVTVKRRGIVIYDSLLPGSRQWAEDFIDWELTVYPDQNSGSYMYVHVE